MCYAKMITISQAWTTGSKKTSRQVYVVSIHKTFFCRLSCTNSLVLFYKTKENKQLFESTRHNAMCF